MEVMKTRNPVISDRIGTDYLAAGLGVRVADRCSDSAVTVELALTHLGALEATFEDGVLTFRVAGNLERENLAESLEWLARRIRVHST
jgi:hypothetical protein